MSNHQQTTLFDDNLLLFSAMIDDIKNAKQSICLETFKIGNDSIGKRFREALLEKAQQGVQTKILVDAYGVGRNELFYSKLIEAGVEVRIFKKLKLFFSNTFARNHTRNHRKLLLIDGHISYIGSSNLTAYSISWRELNLRIDGSLCSIFEESFNESFLKYRQYSFDEILPFEKIAPVHYQDYVLYQDTPSTSYQTVRKKIMQMIGTAKEEVVIETPYFLPGYKMRKALVQTALRGIKVRIFLPLHSDIPIIDLLRNKYLGQMWKYGIEWRFYKPDNLHAKCVMVDGTKFLVGSSNFDYRSFRYQYDIMLYGTDEKTLSLLKEHIDETDKQSVDFDYDKWKNIPLLYKITEWLITPFRRLF
ncbi:MAG: phospholipase D-like domain-containing protein [Bacteroidales bacterium]|jgi:cardiolipin synthase|nr:phospholipase D-like domain-containing protein [Bacteroidales bacterium]